MNKGCGKRRKKLIENDILHWKQKKNMKIGSTKSRDGRLRPDREDRAVIL